MVFTKLDATFLFCWMLGALSYQQIGSLHKKSAVLGCVLAGTGYAICQLTSESVSFDKYTFLTLLPSRGVAILALSAGLALVIPVLSQSRPASTFLAAFERLGRPLAAFSYTLYLTHYPLIELCGRMHPNRHQTMSLVSMLWFAAEIGFCLVVAWLLYLPFERKTGAVRAWLRSCLATNPKIGPRTVV
jgi:peptidoglycan/LPS O-acetylase OafA/YrhL